MKRSGAATVLMVPGLRDEVPDHWQTLLAQRLPAARSVQPLGRVNLDCAMRVQALERAARGVIGPLIVVAHSAGVLTVIHCLPRTARSVRGALLAVPPDFETALPEGYPETAALRA